MLLKPAFPVLNREYSLAGSLLYGWMLTEGRGDTVRDGVSGIAASNAGAWSPGCAGHAITTTAGHITFPSRQLPLQYAISVKFRADENVTGSSGAEMLPLVLNSGSTGQMRYRLTNNGSLRVQPTSTTDTGMHVSVPVGWRVGHWHHMLAIWDSRRLDVVFDGHLFARVIDMDAGPIIPWISSIGGDARTRNLAGAIDHVLVFGRALSRGESQLLSHDPYAAFREPRSKFAWLFVSPPEAITAPTLQINSDGTWTGGLGTWLNEPTSFAWELRRAADDSVVDSGSTSDAGVVLVGSGLSVGNYYLWVLAGNSGGSGVAESGVGRYRLPVTGPVSRTPVVSQLATPVVSSVQTPVVAVV